MIEADLPTNEADRLAALLACNVLDTAPEETYDDLTRIASQICDTPIALVSLIDSERQWFKSRFGLDATETSRDVAFCSHAILTPDELLVVPDSSLDERFCDNPIAVGPPHVRFYAGAPLVGADGLALGTLCVIDHEPRELDADQLDALRALARQVVTLLELRRSNAVLHELAREVQQANQELQRFTSVAAHGLREPLGQLHSFSDLLRTDLGDDISPAADEDLGWIVESVDRMDRLVGALLELSRTGATSFDYESVDLEDCARIALDSFVSQVFGRDVEFEIEPLPTVRGDEALMTQVFQNLVGNALRFTTTETPRLSFTCAVEDGQTIVGVKDNGVGMTAEESEQVFAPFVRLVEREKNDGAGIGLTIVRKIVERHGGRIWCESTPGEGSHFRFTLAGMEAPDAASHAA